MAKSPAVSNSSTEAATATRRKVFAERYLINGNNATEAAKFAGYSEKTAYSLGSRMLKHPDVQAIITARSAAIMRKAELTTDRWAEEMACIGHFDPGELYDAEGNLIPIHKLPAHVRRAIASVEVDVNAVTNGATEEGETKRLTSTTHKIKLWDKNTALANIGKHLGVFEQDNRQRTNAIQVNVVLRG